MEQKETIPIYSTIQPGLTPTRIKLLSRSAWASMGLYAWAAAIGGAVLPQLAVTFKMSNSLSGFLLAVPSFGFTLAGLIGGWFSERIGLQRLLALSAISLIVSLGLASIAPIVIVIIIATMLIGFSGGLLEVGSNGLIASLYHDKAASQLNLLHVFYGGGAFLSPLFVGFCIANSLSWRINYSLSAGLVMILALVLSNQPHVQVKEASRLNVSTIPRLISRPSVLRAWLAIVFFTSAEVGLSTWLVTYFQKVKSFPPVIASTSLSIFWIAMLVGRVVNFRLPSFLSLADVIRFEVLGSILSVIIILLGRYPLLILLGTFLDGLFMAGLFPNLIAYASHNSPDSIGSISGITLAGAGIGMTLGPWIIGLLADQVGLGSAFYLPIFMLAIVEVVFLMKIPSFERLDP